MKKVFLFAAIAATVLPGRAGDVQDIADRPLDSQLETNYIENGGFESLDYVYKPDIPYSWSEEMFELETLPGWNIKTSGKWNGVMYLKENEVDDEYILEGNEVMLHVYHYDENGWADMYIGQAVKGLTPGTEYTIDFLIAHSYNNVPSWVTPVRSLGIYELDPATGTEGREIEIIKNLGDESAWEYYVHKFTTSVSDIYVKFLFGVKTYDDKTKKSAWVELDEVRLYDAAKLGSAGIEEITGDDESAVVEYYNLQGIRVDGNSDLHGVFIRRQGEKTSKVIL